MDALARHVARMPMPAAVVAGGDGPRRADAIRSLAWSGVPVVAVDNTGTPGRFRAPRAFAVFAPDAAAAPQRFVDLLLDLAGVLGRPSPLFPLDDGALDAIAAGRERLGDRYRVPFPSRERIAALRLRSHQLDRARALGIRVPRSADEPTDDLGFPVLVTPGNVAGFRRRFGVQSIRCATRGELDDALARARGFDPLVEEAVPGDELASVGGYLSDEGEVRAVFCVRRSRGADRGARRRRLELSASGDVVEQAVALLHDLSFRGLAQVDFLRDARDGAYNLVAVEPRLSRWHGFAAASGVDLARVAYWDLLGARLPDAGAVRGRGLGRRPFVSGGRPLLGAVARVARRLEQERSRAAARRPGRPLRGRLR